MDKVNGLIISSLESAAQMSVGQVVLRIVDRILWIIEKSVQWSLPSQEVSAEENGKTFGKVELVRPLPWIIFLPALLFLRIIRMSLDALGTILGYPRVEPSDVVRVIQKGRRRLRAIKSSGLKSIRLKKTPIIKAPPMSEETNAIDSAIGSPNQDSKRKYSELSSDDSSEAESDEEPLISKIDRLANTSGSDKDFSIGDCSSDEASETSASESEADVSIPLSELEDLKAEKEEMDKQWCDNLQCPRKPCDDELHKLTKCLEKLEKLNAQPRLNGVTEDEEQKGTTTVMENHKYEALPTNGVGNDIDTAYYSPISWKSVSPEVSISSDKQDNHVDIGEKTVEESNNRQVNNNEETKEKCKNGSKNLCIDGVSGHQSDKSIKEKQRSSSQTSGSGKHHQKHKRGNHGNRKKK